MVSLVILPQILENSQLGRISDNKIKAHVIRRSFNLHTNKSVEQQCTISLFNWNYLWKELG